MRGLRSAISGHDHASRIRIAQSLVNGILERRNSQVLAIGIYGSVARNEDGPGSDLDMTVVTRDDLSAESKCYTYCGLSINLDYQSWEESRAEALDPLQAGNWLEFTVLHDPTEIVMELCRLTDGLIISDHHRSCQQLLWGELPTWLGKIRNAAARQDRLEMSIALPQFGLASVRVVCLLNGVLPTGRRSLLTETLGLTRVPDGYADFCTILVAQRPMAIRSQLNAAERLWEGLSKSAEELGILPEADRLEV